MNAAAPCLSALRVGPWRREAYADCLAAMRDFTAQRDAETADEIWLREHQPVFTLGQASRSQHLHATGDIAVVATERGGQVTYHGPGQVVAYPLVDLARRRIRLRDFIALLEQSVIDELQAAGLPAQRHDKAPGVYLAQGPLAGAKIASVGVKVSRGRSYHGIALNVAMDLEPFTRIDPCGYPGLVVTDMRSALAASAQTGQPSASPSPAAVAHALGHRIAGAIQEASR